METNIYYQLAQTECALDRCKCKLFCKNLTIIGLAGMVYILAKVGVTQVQKTIDAKKERDEAVEEKEKALEELRQMKQEDEKKTTTCCDGHVKMTDVYDKLKND